MYRIGIDLGGTNVAAGLVGEDKKIIKKISAPTGATRSPEYILDDIASLCRQLLDATGINIGDISAVGVATPGIANSDTGIVEYANNLPFRKLPMVQMLRDRFPAREIRIANDANAAAWGEAVAGAAAGTHSSIMITLGTGVGGGIIIDDKIYTGFNHAGAELGHIVICADGRACSCGRHGCWEAYSSATALIAMTNEKIAECAASGRDTVMGDLAARRGKVSGRTAFDAMRAGDVPAREVVDLYLHYLACGLINIVNIFQPEVISIGGGISNERENLLRPLLPLISTEQYGGGIVPATELRIAQLGNDAGIVGAAMLG